MYRIATLNIQGLGSHSLGKRELLEIWAEENNIDIILLQETHLNITKTEKRGRYTIFYSGDERSKSTHTPAGVAIMIHNKHKNTIADINPMSDRIMTLELRG